MNKVYRESIIDIDGEASRANQLENAQILGNRRCVVQLQAQPNDNDGDIAFAITSQKDETGADVNLFGYNGVSNLLIPTGDIDNITLLKFHHLLTYEGDNSSGGNNDANDNFELLQRIVDLSGNVESREEIDRISDAMNLNDNEFISKRVITEPSPPLDPTQSLGISQLIGLGWSLQSFGNPVLTMSDLTITIEINWFDDQAVGGTD